MNEEPTYAPNYEVNKPLYGFALGQVVDSLGEEFKEGDFIFGMFKWQTYVVVPKEKMKEAMIQKVPDPSIPLSHYLGIFGVNGLTAYFGLLDIGNPQKGETVVISGAAGGVGLAAGQIAKLRGCKVVGIAGSKEKIQAIKSFGYDTGCNYKEEDFEKQLKDACPNGVDIYFDNVGGPVSDAVLKLLNLNGRVACCGTISGYNKSKKEQDIGLRPQSILVERSAKMQGFIVFKDYGDRWNEGLNQMLQWYRQGQLKWKEVIIEGIENTFQAFAAVLGGKNIGKQLVKVSDPQQAE